MYPHPAFLRKSEIVASPCQRWRLRSSGMTRRRCHSCLPSAADGRIGRTGGRTLMFRNLFVATVIAGASLALAAWPSSAQPRQVQVGTLTCSLSASIGLIIASQKNVNCVFRGRPGEPEEAYTGTMTTVGVDIGVTSGGVIIRAYCRHRPLFRHARRNLCRGDGGGVGGRRPRRQCACRRIAPQRRLAAIIGAGTDRPRYCRRHRRIGAPSGAIRAITAP